MKAIEIIKELQNLAPLTLQESYDNSGLMCGDVNRQVESAIFSLDCTEKVVDEAIEKGCGLLICHHPLIFGNLKSISGKNEVERCLIKAIKHDLIIYAIHTNLDNVQNGVNKKLADVIGLKNLEILRPKKSQLTKLVFFVPEKDAEKVRTAVFDAGAGDIGNYSDCSFSAAGVGTFKAGEETNPHLGEIGKIHSEREERVEVIVPNYLCSHIVKTLLDVHPYEEVAYDLYALENYWSQAGSGMIGDLNKGTDAKEFLKELKSSLNCGCIRHTDIVKKEVKKIAICGGSGSFLLADAIAKGADVLVTADYKYHQFFEAEGKILIADVGHFESEQFTPHLLEEYLQEKFPNFATYLSQSRTNPINYL